MNLKRSRALQRVLRHRFDFPLGKKKDAGEPEKGGKASARALYPLDIGDCVFCQGSKVPRLPTPVRFDV